MTVQEEYMHEAIKLAKKGRGKVSPNPLVGCVIVKEGKIIGEGYHQEYGKEHAEINALNNCSESPADSDMYITLEPCSIYGKTPPCINSIVSNGIRNVYIGSTDINPDINGKGIEALKVEGVNVFQNILEEQCMNLNKGFFNWIINKKPWVIVKLAQSKNGYLGIDSHSQTWITGKDSIVFTHKMRSKVDAILVGRNTAEVDNPSLTVREVIGTNPIRIIADTYRKLPLTLKLFNDKASQNIVLCSKNKFEDSETPFCKYITVKEENNRLDPLSILHRLGELNITSLLIEGGRDIVKSFFDNDLIDEIYLYTSKDKLSNANLLNPINIDTDNWNIVDEKEFENDDLVIVRKKELCFQE